MIGNFARMLRPGTPAYAVEREMDEAHGAPPERFVEKLSDEGGDVYVAPVLESLRAALRRAFHPSPPAPQPPNDDPATEAP